MATGDTSKEMLARVRLRLGDRAGTTWTSDTTLYAFLNEGFMALAQNVADAALYNLKKVQSAALVGGTAYYDLPTDFLRPRIVKYKDIVSIFWPVEEIQALIDNPLYTVSESNPFFYIWDGDLYFEVGSVTQGGSDTYELWYIKTPTTISASADPDLGQPFYQPVEDFAVSRALEAAQEYELSAVMMAHFYEATGLINERYKSSGAFSGIPNDPRSEAVREVLQ